MLTPIVRANSDPSSDLGSEPVLCFLQLLKTATRTWYHAVYRVCDAHAVNLQKLDFDRTTFCTLTTDIQQHELYEPLGKHEDLH